MPRIVGAAVCAAALLLLHAAARAAEPPPSGEKRGGGEGGGSGGAAGAGGGGEDLPAPLGGLFDALDPGRAHRRFDEFRGRDTITSPKPKAPEIPLAVFVEAIRPLGTLKYENQLNYFVSGFTGPAPTFQSVTYEYVFADWHAARFEMIAPAGRVEALAAGYQRTFGVGPRGNWVHGALVLPEFAVNGSGFVGGTTFYTFAWKPEPESPWTVGVSGGANRASFANRPLAGSAEGGPGSMMFDMPGLGRPTPRAAEREDEARVWRGFAAADVFYTFSPKLTVGLEGVAYPHPRFGEYLVQPILTWRPTKHFFVQFGAGYYEVGGTGQGVVMCRANFLNPSPRKPREGDRVGG